MRKHALRFFSDIQNSKKPTNGATMATKKSVDNLDNPPGPSWADEVEAADKGIEEGDFQPVVARKKGHAPKASTSRGMNNELKRADEREAQARELLRQERYKARECYICGEKGHKAPDCPKRGSPSTQPAGTQPSGTQRGGRGGTQKPRGGAPPRGSSGHAIGAGPSSRGTKRTLTSSSGLTPPSKRPPPGARKYSYAKATSGSTELVILSRTGKHVTKEEFRALEQDLQREFLKELEEGKTPLVPEIEAWEHYSTVAVVKLTGRETEEAVRLAAATRNLSVMAKASWEAQRRPTKFMSGLLRGATARLNKEQLGKLLEVTVTAQKIPGRMEIASIFDTPRQNRIVRVLIDDVAESRFKDLDYTLRFGFSDKVLFSDTKPADKTKVNNQPTKEARVIALEKSIASHKTKVQELEKARADTLQEPETDTETLDGAVAEMNLTEVERLLESDDDEYATPRKGEGESAQA